MARLGWLGGDHGWVGTGRSCVQRAGSGRMHLVRRWRHDRAPQDEHSHHDDGKYRDALTHVLPNAGWSCKYRGDLEPGEPEHKQHDGARIKATPATHSARSRTSSPNRPPSRRPTWVATKAWTAIHATVKTIEMPSSPALKPTVSSSTLMLSPRSRIARPRAWASRRRRPGSGLSSWPARNNSRPATNSKAIPP